MFRQVLSQFHRLREPPSGTAVPSIDKNRKRVVTYSLSIL
ncbi:hypothetical protein GCWU000341_01501 [Oribacterium sp. oral taxon 078 str. F0262]|nr:hypothetical protein GCWU000341_01501 [Oribacterium sp. oral taxon 078 str. F0262]